MIFIGTGMVSGQESLNDYKYVIVPKKFDAFKTENQYLTSTYIKHLFTEWGIETAYEDALPEELKKNRCLGLVVALKDDSNMFTTKTTLALKDCNTKEVFATQQGTSKIKEFKEAYKEAIGMAFTSFYESKYAYTEKAKSDDPITISFKDDVKSLEASKESKPVSIPNPVVSQQATLETQRYKSNEPAASNYQKAEDPVKAFPVSISNEAGAVWYAQTMAYGYQLVDNMPKVQMQLYHSSIPNVFIAKKEDKSGLVYAKDTKWYFEYYEGATPKIEEISIKF